MKVDGPLGGEPAQLRISWLHLALSTLFLCLVWITLILLTDLPTYVLPTPVAVVKTLTVKWEPLAVAAGWTALESVSGLLVGCLVALILGTTVAMSERFGGLIEPYVVISQTFPVYAIAPLLVLWLGYGTLPKVLTAALVCFFPLAIATVHGLRSTDSSLLDVGKALGISRLDEFRRVRMPSALPGILSAGKVSATLSVIGAVIGEFVSPQGGLGYIILSAQANTRVDVIFAALFLLSTLGFSLYYLAARLEHSYLKKRRIRYA